MYVEDVSKAVDNLSRTFHVFIHSSKSSKDIYPKEYVYLDKKIQ